MNQYQMKTVITIFMFTLLGGCISIQAEISYYQKFVNALRRLVGKPVVTPEIVPSTSIVEPITPAKTTEPLTKLTTIPVIVLDLSAKAVSQEGNTCGSQTLKNGQALYKYLMGMTNELKLNIALAQQPAVCISDMEEEQIVARAQKMGLKNFTALGHMKDRTADLYEFLEENQKKVLSDCAQAIITKKDGTYLFSLGNMEHMHYTLTQKHTGTYGHWIILAININRQKAVTYYYINSLNTTTTDPHILAEHDMFRNTIIEQFNSLLEYVALHALKKPLIIDTFTKSAHRVPKNTPLRSK